MTDLPPTEVLVPTVLAWALLAGLIYKRRIL